MSYYADYAFVIAHNRSLIGFYFGDDFGGELAPTHSAIWCERFTASWTTRGGSSRLWL